MVDDLSLASDDPVARGCLLMGVEETEKEIAGCTVTLPSKSELMQSIDSVCQQPGLPFLLPEGNLLLRSQGKMDG